MSLWYGLWRLFCNTLQLGRLWFQGSLNFTVYEFGLGQNRLLCFVILLDLFSTSSRERHKIKPQKPQPDKEVSYCYRSAGHPELVAPPAGKSPLSSSLLPSLSEDDVSTDDAMVTLCSATGDDIIVSCSSLPKLAWLESSIPYISSQAKRDSDMQLCVDRQPAGISSYTCAVGFVFHLLRSY